MVVTFSGIDPARHLEPIANDPVCSYTPPNPRPPIPPPDIVMLDPNCSGANHGSLPSSRTIQLNPLERLDAKTSTTGANAALIGCK